MNSAKGDGAEKLPADIHDRTSELTEGSVLFEGDIISPVTVDKIQPDDSRVSSRADAVREMNALRANAPKVSTDELVRWIRAGRESGSRISEEAASTLPGRKLVPSKTPRMLEPFEVELLRQDLRAALKLLGK